MFMHTTVEAPDFVLHMPARVALGKVKICACLKGNLQNPVLYTTISELLDSLFFL